MKAEPQETSEHRSSYGGNLVINEGRRQPSPSRGQHRVVRPKDRVTPPVVVKQERVEMDADLDTGLKWSRDDYAREKMER
ncbi:hypothetical protein D1007_41001 [Hordeum vulgare]|nr:hypothetical protein D1007_41001 [Hordeum vulgare]